MDPKPNEFYLRAYDLFAILVPGLTFVGIVFAVTWPQLSILLEPLSKLSELWLLGVVLLVGFVVGHIIEGIGSFLDDLEWRLMARALSRKNQGRPKYQVIYSLLGILLPVLRELSLRRDRICKEVKKVFPDQNITIANVRRWALVYLGANASAEDLRSIEHRDAQRKAVRNIAVLALLCCLCSKIRDLAVTYDSEMRLLTLLYVLVAVTWHRHSQLQWKYSQVVFDYFTAYRSATHDEQEPTGAIISS